MPDGDEGPTPTTITTERHDDVLLVTIDRPAVRNAVDPTCARALADAFVAFDDDERLSVAVLAGAGGTFCAGADLTAVARGEYGQVPPPAADGDTHDTSGPMGPSRLRLGKPVIAAIAGHAVAGGLELALWCDLRVVEEDAVLGVFCRRWGVPLIDGGTVRLPRLVGEARALDLVLTGRPVGAAEALAMGLASRVVAPGTAVEEALDLARRLAALPQTCLRSDRRSVLEQWDLTHAEAMGNETRLGAATIATGETVDGAARFVAGAGRGGVAAGVTTATSPDGPDAPRAG